MSNVNDIVINGRAQVVEILKKLPYQEKQKIINEVLKKNPSLGKELNIQCYGIQNVFSLESSTLKIVLEYSSSQVIALAISNEDIPLQQKILTLMPREKALQTLNIIRNQSYSEYDQEKAKNKLIDITMSLANNKNITF
jgi:flagellar motor switch protein FliG